MKIEIVWHETEDLETAAQRGMSYNTTIIVNGAKHTISFVEFDRLIGVVQAYKDKNLPLTLNNFIENGLVISDISEKTIFIVIARLSSQNGLSGFPYIKDDQDSQQGSDVG